MFSDVENPATDSGRSADIWEQCRDGQVSRTDLWEAYRDNLEWVLEDIYDRLLTNLSGEVTLTADHGNGMGELGTWGHPPGVVTPSVRKVPVWHATGVDEGTVNPSDIGYETDVRVEEQLEALGYK